MDRDWATAQAATMLPMNSAFEVGPLTAAPGKMASGSIDLGDTTIPVTVFNGIKDGPVLALIAGNHGYEYPPILALQMLRAKINPKKLAGALILVHVANMPSFLGRTVYFSPIDQKNLNRVYPGKAGGSVSERIAFAITGQVIERCDYLLDLHGGDGNESLRPYVYQIETGDPALDDRIGGLAAYCGFDHIVIDRGRPRDPAASELRGKRPALSGDDGGRGQARKKSDIPGSRAGDHQPGDGDSLSQGEAGRDGEPRRGAGRNHRLLRPAHRAGEISGEGQGFIHRRHAADHQRPAGRLRGSGQPARLTGSRGGSPYSTPTRNSPRAGADGPGANRAPGCKRAARSAAVRFPLPASSRTPTILRTMCFKNPLPRTRKMRRSSHFSRREEKTRRTFERFNASRSSEAAKQEKSCSPS